jgi:hypothetical protein
MQYMCIRDYRGNFIRAQTMWRKGSPLPHEAEAWSLELEGSTTLD